MPNLTDLDVERVDAVDLPATRRRFLIVKDEAGAAAAAAAPVADPATEIRALLESATSMLGVIEKSAAFASLDDDVAEALDALAKAAGVNPFAAGRKKKPAADEPVAEAKSAAAPAAPAAPAVPAAAAPGIDLAAFAAAVGEAVTKAMAPVVEGQAAIARSIVGVETLETSGTRTAPPPSGQVVGQAVAKSGAPRKMGEGMFEGVFHG